MRSRKIKPKLYKFKWFVGATEAAEVMNVIKYNVNGKILEETYKAYPELQEYFEEVLPDMPKLTLNIPKLLREYREELGLDQHAMATVLGVAQQSVSRWERGKVQPNKLAYEYLIHWLLNSRRT